MFLIDVHVNIILKINQNTDFYGIFENAIEFTIKKEKE